MCERGCAVSPAESAITALLEVMARLRDPQAGCRWDLAQDFRSIAPYTIEEAYEVADAIERDDAQSLRDELGDLLFQVVFHARMAQERDWFDFADVAAAIRDKLVRRHPHVFGADPQALDGAALETLWEEQKARERAAGKEGAAETSALADVPLALPALTRAAKLGRRAARVGFDWEQAAHVRSKVVEELAELDAALGERPSTGASTQEPSANMVEEFGDVLFALANWGRHLRMDPEAALRAANQKFEGRFRHMESLARARNLTLQALSAQAWEALWLEAKEARPPEAKP
jgi:tetrapyrrole methylase family protein/MazG family protein/ATP diphosphatase